MTNEFLARSGLGDQIGFQLRQATSAVWADLVATLAPLDLKPQVYATLQIVATSPGCKQQDIADALGIQRPNMVALIDELVGRRWILRQVNPADRRSNTLGLTEAGRDIAKRARDLHRQHEARVAKALDGLDSALASALLGKLAEL